MLFMPAEDESLIHLLQKCSVIRDLCLATLESSIVDKLWSIYVNHPIEPG